IAERQTLQTSHHDGAQLARTLADTEAKLADALRARQQLADEIEAARADRDQLSAALDESRRHQQRATAALEQQTNNERERQARDTELARLRDLVAQHQTKVPATDRNAHDRISTLETRLANALAEQSTQQRLIDEFRASKEHVRAAADEQRQLVAALERRLAATDAERARLAAAAEEQQHVRRQLESDRDLATA